MCGVFGIQFGPGGPAAEEFDPQEAMQAMFKSIVTRGRHSWGYVYYDPADRSDTGKPEVQVFKMAGAADAPGAIPEQILPASDTLMYVLGHVRFETHGSSSNLNNVHPIIHRNIVGVHNGVISNYSDILKVTGRHDPDTQVDSEAIFASINAQGPSRGRAAGRGDMATLFIDRRRPKIVRVARSEGRPLVIARTAHGAVLWASEEKNLRATGITFSSVEEWHDTNVMLSYKQGKLVGRDQYAPPSVKKSTTTSYSSSSSSSSGWQDYYKKDDWGGEWQYGNKFKAADGRIMNANDYIKHIVKGEVAKATAAVPADDTNDAPLGAKIKATLERIHSEVGADVKVGV